MYIIIYMFKLNFSLVQCVNARGLMHFLHSRKISMIVLGCPLFPATAFCLVYHQLRSTYCATMFPPPTFECSMATGLWQLLQTVCSVSVDYVPLYTTTITIHLKRLSWVLVLMQCNIYNKKPKLLHKWQRKWYFESVFCSCVAVMSIGGSGRRKFRKNICRYAAGSVVFTKSLHCESLFAVTF